MDIFIYFIYNLVVLIGVIFVNVSDFDYELQIAQSNRKVSKETIDTVFLTTSIDYAYLSSSIVREYASYGTDVSDFVPEFVAKKLENRFR